MVDQVSALEPARILAFAQQCIQGILGKRYEGEVFLAGGVFKTLLHGLPPRDYDLWTPNEPARELLLNTLLSRGATILETAQYQYRLQLDGMHLEVPYSVSGPTLTDRLARFDLALSAIGVSWNGSHMQCQVHPLAHASVQKRQILLLPELLNWRHSLKTFERMHRYGAELGYEVPLTEVDRIREIFLSQSEAMRQGMLQRYSMNSPQSRVLDDVKTWTP